MQTPRQKILTRAAELRNERSSWLAHWRDISEHLLPRTGRFLDRNRNRGDKRHNNIYDSTGTRSLRILAAGMMAGMTSPARPWFRLTTSVPDLDEADSVKRWLADTTRLMQMIFQSSNTYRALHGMYEELGAFGTAASVVLSDFDNVIHHYPLVIGEYSLADDDKGRVNTVCREFEMTVEQVVGAFGLDKVSRRVRNMYERGNYLQQVQIIHLIEPRRERDRAKRDALNMPWRSVYIEAGGDEGAFLRESGFRDFRALCPRWAVQSGDVYGSSPGMEALGDVKQLQHQQLRKAQAIDYQTKPPMQAPTALENRGVNLLPGGVTFVDQPSSNAAMRPAFEASLNLQHLLLDIQDVRERIKASFYADLFLMLAGGDLRNMTATEVAERHEEKLLMLGPVLERMHNEILAPKIEMTFASMIEANIVPPAPPELQGMELNIEFVSMLAQAQRAVATNGIDRFVANIGVVAQYKPDVLDKFDSDHWADAYADMLGVEPDFIVPGDKVALIRQARAEAAQAQQQAEMTERMAGAMQKLGSVDTGGENIVSDATRAFSGYS